MQCAGAGGCDPDVRRQSAVRIDFVRRIRQDGALDADRRESFDGGEKKCHVGAGLLEIAVARHDEKDDARWSRLGRTRDEERLRRRRQTGDEACRNVHAAAGDGRFQKGAEVERG